MKNPLLRLTLLLLCTFGLAQPARGAVDMFLQLDDVKGAATDSSFKDQIVVLAANYSITPAPSTGSSSPGKPVPGNLVITKPLDRATPLLAQAAAAGTPYRQATLSVRQPEKGEQKVVYTITLNDVRVVAVAQGAVEMSEAHPLTEKVSLSYASITWAYGSTKAGFNFSSNTKTLKTAPDEPDTAAGNFSTAAQEAPQLGTRFK